MPRCAVTLHPSDEAPIINPDIYGHFAEHLGHCIYGGLWVGEDSPIPNTRGIRNDVVEALKKLDLPVLRWPGGCFADEYHWKDGIGPRDQRPSIYNSHWGGVVENNHFGTHEFFELCEQIGCEAYVCGNVGSGTVQEMSEWVEYMTSPAESPMADLRRKNGRQDPWKLKYFGVGNESWGCGGNMRPEYYADLYRRYNTYVRNYGPERIERIACGPNVADYHWTRVMMDQVGERMDALALHNYTILDQKWPPSGSATEFGEREYRSILRAALHTEHLIQEHAKIMDEKDPDRTINLAVDEWGAWHPVEPGTNPGFLFQQNTVRDALVAAVHFDAFHRHAERVRLANIAQMVNVLQAMVLTDGPRMLLTPTYHVFNLYRNHQGAQRVDLTLEAAPYSGDGPDLPSLSATASRKDGTYAVSVSNLDPNQGQTIAVCGLPPELKVESAQVIAGEAPQSHNTFDIPNKISPQELDVRLANGSFEIDLPAASVATVLLKT